MAKAYEVQLNLGQSEFTKATAMTFETYSRERLDTHCFALKLGTRKKYAEIIWVHWVPAIGFLALTSITRTQVKAIVTAKARLYTRGTVSYMIKESEMEKKQVTVYSNVG